MRITKQLSLVKKSFKIIIETMIIACLTLLLPVIAFVRFVLRFWKKYQRRSIWTGAPIITMTLNAAVEKQLGFQTKTIVRSTYFVTNKFDLNILNKSGNNPLIAILLTYAIFAWICLTADRVHAYVDGGLLPSKQLFHFRPLELFFYNLLKVKLFVWTYGADVRTQSITKRLGEPNCCSECTSVGSSCICDEADASTNYQRVAKVAKAIFSMGDMTEYTPNSQNNLFFWPIDFNSDAGKRYIPVYPELSSKPLRVVHAPNHRQFKGTRYLEQAVEDLKSEGIPIDLVLVEKVPNEQALAIYRSADVIFDQCLIGFHGYFAIEAMALGKPVLCFIRTPEKYLLKPEQCPLVNVHRDELKNALRRLATDERASLTDIGRRSRAYVEQHYSMDAFALRLKQCYQTLGVAL